MTIRTIPSRIALVLPILLLGSALPPQRYPGSAGFLVSANSLAGFSRLAVPMHWVDLSFGSLNVRFRYVDVVSRSLDPGFDDVDVHSGSLDLDFEGLEVISGSLDLS